MNRHDFLNGLHERLAPRSYVEIGVNQGHGLARSRTRTIGVDPAFQIKSELACDLKLVRQTSDDFFAGPDPLEWFPEGVIDFAFIDGLHVFEFALRDFINCERLGSATSLIVLDDMLPRTVPEAARDRYTTAWAGDVYKVTLTLQRYRPDLVVVPIDTKPTGMVVVVGLDPASTVLRDRYDEILAEFVTPDPQDVPAEVLQRTTAADPKRVLHLPVWEDLRLARTGDGAHPASLSSLRDSRGTASYVSNPPPLRHWESGRGGGKRTLAGAKRALKRRL
jgi:hypothetical protein